MLEIRNVKRSMICPIGRRGETITEFFSLAKPTTTVKNWTMCGGDGWGVETQMLFWAGNRTGVTAALLDLRYIPSRLVT